MLDLECMLVDLFHWNMPALDASDIESLIPFVFRYPHWKKGRNVGTGKAKKVFVDEVNFL